MTYMNSRDYKIFRSGFVYHVYNRGNNKGLVFCCDNDYTAFLVRLKLALGKSMSKVTFDKQRIRITSFARDTFSILAYCLMPNHYHFLIKQNTDVEIGQLIHRVFTSYSKYYNLKHEKVGNLFQDTFKAKLVDNDIYLKYVSAYIHNNPAEPLLYPYSSFLDYQGLRDGTLCDRKLLLGMFNNNRDDYKKFVVDFTPKQYTLIQPYIFEDSN